MGGSSSRPSTAPITGTSNDYVEVLLGLSEGQVQGLVNEGQGIFLDGTPSQNSDGSKNFPDLQWRFFDGRLNQDVGSAISEQSILNLVNVEVRYLNPITRTIVNSDINAIRVRVGLQLQKQKDNGSIERNSIAYKILLKTGAGPFIEIVDVSLEARYSSLTVFEYLIPVDSTQDEFNVRVEKLSEDGNNTNNVRNLTWLTFAEVNQSLIEYANTCVIRTQFPSNLFSSNPSLEFLLAGILVDIPSNAVVDTQDGGLTYSGAWDGTFYKPSLATADPAWIVYALLTNPRFGLGIPPRYIDKWELYSCSLHNNGFVANGYGGQEKRFLFNGILLNQQGGIDGLRTVCAAFAAKPYWNGTQISFWQDRPYAMLPKILCNADVENGTFVYSSGELLTVTTCADVIWQNPRERYNSIPEPVSHPAAINRYGVFREKFTAFGEIRRSGAIRAGRRVILNSLPHNNQQISCKVRPRALFFRPGDVIQIADSARGRQRKSGLIKSATLNVIYLDAPTSISNASDRRILVSLPDETTEERQILNPAGEHSIVNLEAPLSMIPNPHATWQIVDGSIDLIQYRIISVEPDSNPNLYQVVAKLYKESLYEEIESGWSLTDFAEGSRPPAIMPAPRNLVVDIAETLDVYWDYPERSEGVKESYLSYYVVEYKIGIGGEWRGQQTTVEQFARWDNLDTGNFYIRVAAVSTNGKVSAWIEANAEFIKGYRPPVQMPNPRNLIISFAQGELSANWDYPERIPGVKEPYLSQYIAEYKIGDTGAWGDRQNILGQSVKWTGLSGSNFYVRVAAVSTNNKTSDWIEGSNL